MTRAGSKTMVNTKSIKNLIVILLIFVSVIILLIVNSIDKTDNREFSIHSLVFNVPEDSRPVEISYFAYAFFLEATETQLNTVFPNIDMNFSGRVSYSEDGSFEELSAYSPENNVHIMAARELRVHSDYRYEEEFLPGETYIHNTHVKAIMLRHDSGNISFFSFFELNNIKHRI